MKRSYPTLAVKGTDFDWEALYARLDEDLHDPANDPRVAESAARLLQMLVPGVCNRLRPAQIGLRVVALAWVLSPDYFKGRPSLRQLAKRCGVSKSTLAEITAEVSRIIHWRNRAQKRAWNWQKSGRQPHR